MKKTNKKKPGFTLIELLVVVLIVGILAGVALPQYSVAVEKARAAEALTLMNAVASASERYCFQKDNWPSGLDQLDIEVPFSSTSFGGKNFSVRLEQNAGTSCTSNNLTILAERYLSTGKYSLRTVLSPGTNETITSTRTCTGTDTKGTTFCNAITNGHNDGF